MAHFQNASAWHISSMGVTVTPSEWYEIKEVNGDISGISKWIPGIEIVTWQDYKHNVNKWTKVVSGLHVLWIKTMV